MQSRSRAMVETILEAAARILRNEGWDGLTTNRIAEVAGVGIGSLYGYFANKEEIVAALAQRILEEDETAIAAALSDANDPVPPLVRALVRRHRTDRVYRRLVLTRHVMQGAADEHARRAEAAIGAVVARLAPDAEQSFGRARIFVAARAVLGVCRALTETANPGPIAAIEDELIAMTRRWLEP